MSLEDELPIIQFAQGIYPKADLLDSYGKLNETKQCEQLFDITALLQQLKLTDDDIEQANARSSLETASNPFLIQRTKLNKVGLRVNMALVKLKNSYYVLLDLFKDAYRRSFEHEKDSSNNWIYQDLSDDAIVQDILAQHKARVEDLYSNTSFRSEFVSLAKVWRDNVTLKEELYRELAPSAGPQTHFNFLSYDEIMTTLIPVTTVSKEAHAINLLLNSLCKATSVRYKLDSDQAYRLVLDVLRRHLLETYNIHLDQ